MSDRVIMFDESLIGMELTEDEKKEKSLKLLEESGYPHETKSIRLINPEMFAKFKYLTKIDIEAMFTKSNDYWQPILMALKGQFAQDPYIDQEALTRKLLYSYFNSEGEDLMKEESQQIPGIPQMANNGMANQLSNQSFNQASNAVNQKVI